MTYIRFHQPFFAIIPFFVNSTFLSYVDVNRCSFFISKQVYEKVSTILFSPIGNRYIGGPL